MTKTVKRKDQLTSQVQISFSRTDVKILALCYLVWM